ncbi:kinase binding protein CGI-121-domain-containing protein [Mycena sp. CBHHK59/15]|nr:kinase binding protein CGI-121-domain-containing protein [Mycena sp. CBHHK59/15]
MESYQLPQFSPYLSCVHVALYTDVSSPDLLRKRLITASAAEGIDGEREREAINFSFVEARLITSLTHLQTAIYQAILAESQGCLRTKSVHSEIIWALNPTNNISEAMRRYGVSDTTTSLIVVRVADIQKKMDIIVKGNKSPFTALQTLTDWPAIKKYHKLGNEVAINRAVINNIVVSSVAMKSVMA